MTALTLEDGSTFNLDGDDLVNGPRDDEILNHFVIGRGLVTFFLLRAIPEVRPQTSLKCRVLSIYRPDNDPEECYFTCEPVAVDRTPVVPPSKIYFRYYVGRNKGCHVESLPDVRILRP